MVSIARKNLLEDLPRFLVAQAGIMFAVSLVTIQTGILNGFTRSTVLLIEESKADLWLTSDQMVHFEYTEPLNIAQLEETKKINGVETAEAISIEGKRWYPPDANSTPLRLIGFEPTGTLFQPGNLVAGDLKALSEPYTVMVDRARLPELEIEGIGGTGKVDSLPARVVAITENTQSIVSPPFVFTSLENTKAYLSAGYTSKVNCEIKPDSQLDCKTVYEKVDGEVKEAPPIQPLSLTDPITHILVAAKPGQDIAALKQRLEAALPGIRAYTPEQMIEQTSKYWTIRTGVGLILGLGASVGVIVGMVVVSQILYSSVSEHIKEFGTLKAIGASDKLLYGVIVEQSLWMAVLGYIPGMLLCLGLSTVVASQGIIILITPGAAAAVFGIIVVMCVSSGFLAIRKVTRIDPAMVFKS